MTRTPLFLCTLGLAGSLAAGPAAALCSEPNLPYCASDGDLEDRFVSRDECRRDVERYLARLAAYKDCLSEALEAAEAERERIERMLSAEEEAPQG